MPPENRGRFYAVNGLQFPFSFVARTLFLSGTAYLAVGRMVVFDVAKWLKSVEFVFLGS